MPRRDAAGRRRGGSPPLGRRSSRSSPHLSDTDSSDGGYGEDFEDAPVARPKSASGVSARATSPILPPSELKGLMETMNARYSRLRRKRELGARMAVGGHLNREETPHVAVQIHRTGRRGRISLDLSATAPEEEEHESTMAAAASVAAVTSSTATLSESLRRRTGPAFDVICRSSRASTAALGDSSSPPAPSALKIESITAGSSAEVCFVLPFTSVWSPLLSPPSAHISHSASALLLNPSPYFSNTSTSWPAPKSLCEAMARRR
jgi:hypothetical protein